MAIKGGAYQWRSLMNDDCTEWILGLMIWTTAVNGNPRLENDVECRVSVSASPSQVENAMISVAKNFITSMWGVTFQPQDTVQIYGCSKFEG